MKGTNMTVVQMQRIATDYGTISVEADTGPDEIAILKQVKPCSFSEFCYTGNSRAGRNSSNYDDLEAWFVAAGLTIKDDDLAFLIHDLERTSGVTALEHRGKTLRYHVQARHGEPHPGFGHRWRADYRLIACH
jgi:hypothetical protein